jgi:hypothetical protein
MQSRRPHQLTDADAYEAWLESDEWTPRQYVDVSGEDGTRRLGKGLDFDCRGPEESEFIDPKGASTIVDLHVKVIRRAIDDGELIAY